MPKTLKKNLKFWLWFIDKGFTLNEDSVKILRGDLVQCLDLVNDIGKWNNDAVGVRPTPTLQATAGFMDSAAQGRFDSNPDSVGSWSQLNQQRPVNNPDNMRARHTFSKGWEHWVDGRWVYAEGPPRYRPPHDSRKWTGL